MTEPGFIALTVSALIKRGANTPPINAVVITTSDCAHSSAEQLALPGAILRRQFFGVAAAGRCAFLQLDADVLRANALDLFLDLGAHVGGHDVGADAPSGGDRLKSRDAGADHEDFRRPDHPGGGHQHGKVAIELDGREQHALVAADVGHRRQRIHRLRARRPRNGIVENAVTRRSASARTASRCRSGISEPTVDRSRTHPPDLVPFAGEGCGDLEQEIAGAGERRRIRFQRRASLGERRVRKTGIVAGARFDRDVIARLISFLHDSGASATRRSPAWSPSGLRCACILSAKRSRGSNRRILSACASDHETD
jgi:hypothetical protein